VSNDPVERARLAWIGARFRFQRVVDWEGGEEEYRQAKAELERAKRLYDQLVAGEPR
jgi:hypothetical protein